jgi:ubiquinone/menaquinone biosynthesis C-methylase UbiE
VPSPPIAGPAGGIGYRRAVALYDRLAAPLWEATVGRRALARVRAELVAQVPPGAAALDLGAGTGRSTRLVLEHANPARVVCVDAAPPMLAELQRRVDDPRVETVESDAASLPFPEDSFDVVVSLWLLETLPDPLAAIREALRVLAPDGTVIAAFSTTPGAPGRRLLHQLIEAVMQPGFAGRFLPESQRPLHRCSKTCAHRHEYGMTTVAVFGKACRLSALALSGTPAGAAPDAAGTTSGAGEPG